MGVASQKLAQIKGSVLVRNISGGIIIIFAVMHLFAISLIQNHGSHAHMGH
jgi:hypothetical protein